MQEDRVSLVYAEIRRRITTNTFSPGQHLAETQLAKEFGVGRHAVRLALERLHAEGLVTTGPNRGAVVASLSLDEALDILLVREVLEGAAARLAAERISSEQLEELAGALEQMREALDSNQFDLYSKTNVRFHQTIYAASGSRKIPELIALLRVRLARPQLRTILVPGRGANSLAEHRAICEALASRDPDAAEKAMRRHISSLREVLAQTWDLVGV